jgi:peptide/nickel transport system substrate-binding protein
MQWSADTTLNQLTLDRAAAEKSLDSLGWQKGADGIRVRNQTPLAFTVLIPGSSPQRQRLAVLMQEQWRQIGADVSIENVDFTAMNQRNSTGSFDAVITALSTSPSPSGIRQSWSTTALSMPGGFNIGGYSNPVVDAAIENALAAHSIEDARRHYRTAYQTLLDDAPAIWVFEPVIRGGAHRRLELPPMRADAWWTSIPRWRIAD